MYEQYHISGIKQSYRSERGPKTIVLPVLIFALLGAMATFYVKTKPGGETKSGSIVESLNSAPVIEVVSPAGHVEKEEEPLPIGSPIPAPVSSSAKPLGETERGKVEKVISDTKGIAAFPLVSAEGIEEEEFTPWMSPLALDTYIRKKNSGHEATYWERGNWIRAVEGRWNQGSHEFRIVLGRNPDPARYGWYYRIDQTEEEFSESIRVRGEEGFSLIQSSVYERPDGSKRYQGVWQLEVTDSSLVNSSRSLRPLDVGTLNFRQ